MKILQLCHKMPFPLHDGGAYSLYHNALGLVNQGADVKVLAVDTPKNQVDAGCIPASFSEKTGIEYLRVDTRFKPLGALTNLLTSRSYFVERFFSEEFNDGLIRVLSRRRFDIVQLEHVYMCLYLETIRKHSKAKVILRPQNVENTVWRSVLENMSNPVKKIYLGIATERLMRFEKEMAQKVDGIIAISGVDAGTFYGYAPGTPIATVPIGFDFSNAGSYDLNRQFDHFPVFYHLGSMDWYPNVQGIKWFIKEVIPYLRVDYPEFVFRIAGKNMPGWFYKHRGPGLAVDLNVAESRAYHEDKAVMIVPLFSGSGLRVKIIEGMALAKTIISTAIGAEGIPYKDQENILIANTKEEFAIQIKKCRDSAEFCKKTGENARLLALGNYDCNVTAKSMMRFYNELLQS
jgi:polysaccharide biosynthesis protein PslH